MLKMNEIDRIRNLYFIEGENISKISMLTGYDRKTVNKYISLTDWTIPTIAKESRKSKLSKYKPEIDEWLEQDKRMKKKQRHTGKRVYDRLKENYSDFDCSYRTVVKYVSSRKKELYSGKKGYLELTHKAGEAQIDFGKAEYIEKGKRCQGSYLSVSFPYSNAGFIQLFKGENFECLAEGLKRIFNHIGGVPHRQWYDNLSAVVKKVYKGGEREVREEFIRFREHYVFTSVFCNPNAGNEKGNVENKVGYARRNFLVPIPEFSDIEQFNKELLLKCDKDMERFHYKKKKLIKELFVEDVEKLNELPLKEFEVISYEKLSTNSYGKFTLNNGKHTYSTSSRQSNSVVIIGKTYNKIKVYDNRMQEVVVHNRLYGKEGESMNWLPYLSQLSRKPNAVKYVGIYKMLPEPVRNWLNKVSPSKISSAIKLLSEITKKKDFELAVKILEKAIECKVVDFDSINLIYKNMILEIPELLPVKLSSSVPTVSMVDTDVAKYDELLIAAKKGGDNHGYN